MGHCHSFTTTTVAAVADHSTKSKSCTKSHAHGKPVAIGGPDATSSPHIYAAADFRVLGEAEAIIDKFVVAWKRGVRAGTFVGAEVYGGRHQVAGPSVRPPEV